MARIVQLCLLLCLVFVSAQALNKYSKEANENIFSQERPFRMQKLNLLWEKATKKLDGKKLKNLYNDLKQQDKDELSLKKLKAEYQDKEGLKEAQIRKQLNIIVRKYGLGLEESVQMKSSDQNLTEMDSDKKSLFKDKKLDKLWKKAHKANLNELQLKLLKEELQHYEDKMEQYHQIISELNHKHARDQARKENLENHIDAFLEAEEKDLKIDETNAKLKQKHIELKDEYRRLSDMVFNVSTNGDTFKGEFEEEQASNLWKLALKSDFTDEELETLRDELLHFQKRIKKLKFFQAQVDSDRMAGKKDFNQPIDDTVNQQKHIVRKVKELNYKVGKIHAEIENRILQRHSEL